MWTAVAVTVLGLIAYHARMGAVSPRIANPEVTGAPRPVEFLFGWPHWLVLHQVGTVVMMLTLVAVCVWAWRRHPAPGRRHPESEPDQPPGVRGGASTENTSRGPRPSQGSSALERNSSL